MATFDEIYRVLHQYPGLTSNLGMDKALHFIRYAALLEPQICGFGESRPLNPPKVLPPIVRELLANALDISEAFVDGLWAAFRVTVWNARGSALDFGGMQVPAPGLSERARPRSRSRSVTPIGRGNFLHEKHMTASPEQEEQEWTPIDAPLENLDEEEQDLLQSPPRAPQSSLYDKPARSKSPRAERRPSVYDPPARSTSSTTAPPPRASGAGAHARSQSTVVPGKRPMARRRSTVSFSTEPAAPAFAFGLGVRRPALEKPVLLEPGRHTLLQIPALGKELSELGSQLTQALTMTEAYGAEEGLVKKDIKRAALDDIYQDDPGAGKVRRWRHEVQKYMLQEPPLQEKHAALLDQIFKEIEMYDGMTPGYLEYSKIAKVMRHVSNLGDERIEPLDTKYRFRYRASVLVLRWTDLLARSR